MALRRLPVSAQLESITHACKAWHVVASGITLGVAPEGHALGVYGDRHTPGAPASCADCRQSIWSPARQVPLMATMSHVEGLRLKLPSPLSMVWASSCCQDRSMGLIAWVCRCNDNCDSTSPCHVTIPHDVACMSATTAVIAGQHVRHSSFEGLKPSGASKAHGVHIGQPDPLTCIFVPVFRSSQ